MEVQKIDYPNCGGPSPDGDAPRIETGPVQFGNDWPGLFIRGDNAFALAMHISELCQLWESSKKGRQFTDMIDFRMKELKELSETILKKVVVEEGL